MSEEDSDERETWHKMWLSEKVTTLEKENQDLERALQEMERRLSLRETTSKQDDERCARIETAIIHISEFVQQQHAAVEGSRVLLVGLGLSGQTTMQIEWNLVDGSIQSLEF